MNKDHKNEQSVELTPESFIVGAAKPAPAPQSKADADAAKAAPAPVADGEQAKPTPPTIADGGTVVKGSSFSREELDQMTGDIVAALKTVYDPEIPTDIYELGLIYRVDISDERNVTIDMTLTAPGCPVAGEMPVWVDNAVRAVPGIQDVKVNLVFDPPWDMSRMSDEARLAINMF